MPTKLEIDWRSLERFVEAGGTFRRAAQNAASNLQNAFSRWARSPEARRTEEIARSLGASRTVINNAEERLQRRADAVNRLTNRNIIQDRQSNNNDVKASDSYNILTRKLHEQTSISRTLKSYLNKILNSKGKEQKEHIEKAKLFLKNIDKSEGQSKKSRYQSIVEN